MAPLPDALCAFDWPFDIIGDTLRILADYAATRQMLQTMESRPRSSSVRLRRGR